MSWTDPANTGADPLLSDTATATDVSNPSSPTNGSTCIYYEPASPSYNSAAPADQCTVTGLTNGDTYTFAVASTNARRYGCCSAASAPIVPSTVPGAPTIGTATSNANAQSVVSFTAPASNGGAAISSYTVRATDTTNPSNPLVTASGAASPITVTGLTNGDTYSFTVTATNVSGTGPASGSITGVPSTVPGAPTSVTATVGGSVGSGDAAGQLDRSSQQRWRRYLQVHRHVLHRLEDLLDDVDPARHPGDHLHGDRADQRDQLHLHGDRHQRRRHQCGLGRRPRRRRGPLGRSVDADRSDRLGGRAQRPGDDHLDRAEQWRLRHHRRTR